MVRERDHGTDRRASPRGGVGGALPGGAGRDRGAAPPGDLAAGAGADRPRSGRGAGLRAALGGAAGRPLQRLRPWGAGRPAAAEWPGGKPAHPRGAVRLGRAAEAAARGWRAVERPQGRGLDGAASWSGGGASAARLGGAEAARVSLQAPRPRHPRTATPEQREALKKSWTRRSRGPRPNTPAARSRSGPRTSTVSA